MKTIKLYNKILASFTLATALSIGVVGGVKCTYGATENKNLHSLVVSGTKDKESYTVTKEVYKSLASNKIPGYVNSKADNSFFSFDEGKAGKGTTKKEFLAKIKSSFSNSKANDINILVINGNGSNYGIDTNADGLISENEMTFSSLAGISLGANENITYYEFANALVSYKGKFLVILDVEGAYNFAKFAYLEKNIYNEFDAITKESFAKDKISTYKKALDAKFQFIGDKNLNQDKLKRISFITTYERIDGEAKSFFTTELSNALSVNTDYGCSVADVDKDGMVTVKELYTILNNCNKNNKDEVLPDDNYMSEVQEYIKLNDNFAIYQANNAVLSLKNVVMDTGANKQLKLAKYTSKKYNNSLKLKWKTSNSNVATVNQNGVVTAKVAGDVNITAYLVDASNRTIIGSGAKCSIKVEAASLKLDKSNITINEGNKKTLVATVTGKNNKVTFKSSNTAVATVNAKGLINAKKKGSAVITASANGINVKCNVKVVKPTLSISCKSANLYVGNSKTVTAKVTGATKTVKWTSSNTLVATVTGGTITAKKAGSAIVTASANGLKATCKITVKKKEDLAAASTARLITTDEYIQLLVKTAQKEIGYLEKSAYAYYNNKSILDSKTGGAGQDNFTKYGRDMHNIYPLVMDFPAAWCDCFVDWCFQKAYGVTNAKFLLCGNFDDYTVMSASYYKNKGQWHTTNPKVGDQVFFQRNGGICHTGIVVGVNGSTVYTIEGNTSSGVGVIANGGCVKERTYSLYDGYIAGFGRPDYETARKNAKLRVKDVADILEIDTKVDIPKDDSDEENKTNVNNNSNDNPSNITDKNNNDKTDNVTNNDSSQGNTTSTTKVYATVKAVGGLYVRNENGAQIGSVQNGQKVTVLNKNAKTMTIGGTNYNMTKISFGQLTGYVANNYLIYA